MPLSCHADVSLSAESGSKQNKKEYLSKCSPFSFLIFRMFCHGYHFLLKSTVPVLRHVSPISSVIRGPSAYGSSTESRWQLTHMVRVSKTDSCIEHLISPPFLCYFPGAIFLGPPVRGSLLKSYHSNTHLESPSIRREESPSALGGKKFGFLFICLLVLVRHVSPHDPSSDSKSFLLIILNPGGSCHTWYGYPFAFTIHCSLPSGLSPGPSTAVRAFDLLSSAVSSLARFLGDSVTSWGASSSGSSCVSVSESHSMLPKL